MSRHVLQQGIKFPITPRMNVETRRLALRQMRIPPNRSAYLASQQAQVDV